LPSFRMVTSHSMSQIKRAVPQSTLSAKATESREWATKDSLRRQLVRPRLKSGSSGGLPWLTVERGQDDVLANRVLPCERRHQLNGVVASPNRARDHRHADNCQRRDRTEWRRRTGDGCDHNVRRSVSILKNDNAVRSSRPHMSFRSPSASQPYPIRPNGLSSRNSGSSDASVLFVVIVVVP
jgi:hypothetical protein